MRVRQLMSVTETQYTGQDILIVAPDSFTLSALQAAALGVDLSGHGEYAMGPGQVGRGRQGVAEKNIESSLP